MPDVIAQLVGKLGFEVDDTGLKKFDEGTKNADKTLGDLSKSLGNAAGKIAKYGAAAALAGAAVLAGLVTSTASAGDEIAKTAKKAGVGATELQRLRYAAQRSGAAASVLDDGIRKLNTGLIEAQTKGTGPFAEGLKLVGVSLKSLDGLNAEQRFGVLADALRNVTDEGERSAIAAKLFGKTAGPGLKPLLDEGSAGIATLGDRLVAIGGLLDGDALAASEAFEDGMLDVKTAAMGFGATLVRGLTPALTEVLNTGADWIAQNNELIEQRVAEFVEEAIPAIKDLAIKIYEVVKAIAEFVEGLGGLDSNLTLATAAALAFAVALGGIPAVAIAVGAAIGLLATDILGFTDSIVQFKREARALRDSAERKAKGTSAIGELSSLLDDPAKLAALSDQEYERIVEDVIAGTSDSGANVGASDAVINRLDNARAKAQRNAPVAMGVTDDVMQAAERAGLMRRRAGMFKGAKGAKGKKGAKEVDTSLASERFGAQLQTLGGFVSATDKAQNSALEAVARSLESGASDGVAFAAGVSTLESLTGATLQTESVEQALESALLGMGNGPGGGGASPTAGAQFVRIDASYNAPTTIEIVLPPGSVAGLSADETMQVVEAHVGDVLDERNRKAFDHFRKNVEV